MDNKLPMRTSLILLLSTFSCLAQLPVVPLQVYAPPNPLLSGLVAAWSFDEQAHQVVVNYTDSFAGLVWTNKGAIGNERGIMGGALSITNTSGLLTITNSSFAVSGSFTMAMWVMGGNANNSNIGQQANNVGTTFDYTLQPGLFQVKDSGGVTRSVNFANNATSGKLQFVVCGFDQANSQIFVSTNGAAKLTAACSSVKQTANMPFDNSYLLSCMDSFCFWNRALTTADITQLYNNGLGLQYPFTLDNGTQQALNWGWCLTNEGSFYTTTQSNAMYKFAKKTITDGTWQKCSFILPMTTTGTSSALTNALTSLLGYYVINGGNDSVYQLFNPYQGIVSFVSGDAGVNGVTGDGASKYVNFGPTFAAPPFLTQIIPNPNSSGLVVYSYTSTSSSHGVEAGAYDTGVTPNYYYTIRVNTSLDSPPTAAKDGSTLSQVGNTPTLGNGYYSVQRESSTSLNLYFANSTTPHALIQNDATSSTTTTFRAIGFTLFNINSNGGVGGNESPNTLSFIAAQKSAFTATDDSNFYDAVQQFRTDVGGGFR